jgi:MFS family permease
MKMESDSTIRFILRSLRHRNYRLFFTGQSLSLIGTWMTQVATSWLIYRVTNSAWLLGFVGFSGQLPAFFLAPFAGVWIDRWNRLSILKITQVLAMLQSFALAAVVFTNHVTVWNIALLTMFQGFVNAFDMPARQSFVVEMIRDRADLANAIALNSMMVNGSRLIGPSIAGFVIAFAGEASCFLIDGFSYLAVIVSLLLMRVDTRETKRTGKNIWSDLKEGWQYVSNFTPIRSLLLLLVGSSLFGLPYSVLLPVFASTVLHGGPHTLGFLTAATGLGAVTSAISLAMRKSIVGLGKMIAITAFTFGGGLIAFGFSHTLWFSLPLMLVVGFSMMQLMSSCNTIMQTIVEEKKRGRVMAFYTMALIGIMPFGSLLAGGVASKVGAPHTVMLGGSICILSAIWFALRLSEIRRSVRPIYVQLGILPEIATGIQAASAVQTPPE